MPRPNNKSALLDLSEGNFLKLMDFVDAMEPARQSKQFPPGMMNRNIRDVIMHLHHWHVLFMNWYTVGMTGEKPALPAEGYTWKTVPDLNRSIQGMYQQVTLDDALAQFRTSYNEVRTIIERHTDEELFEKKRYAWTGTTSLGAYLISATSSHYDWGLKLIRKALK